MVKTHSFHIPVLGIGFSIDTPVKVAHFGIDSVISLVDDKLIEKLRRFYSGTYKIPYTEITENTEDYRARRISSYLDLLQEITERKFEEFKSAATQKLKMLEEYLGMMPDKSDIKAEFNRLLSKRPDMDSIKNWMLNNLSPGHIDVNIMSKIDKVNYKKGEALPAEYNDAHAAIRGFANSKLHSSLILSAGINPRLYTYMENFEDFYPDESGQISKKIVLKVSDYKSAMIQGKFLAKKGLWVSEYRVESGLNCGGHAFATEGYLIGPILAEFRDKRTALTNEIHEILATSLKNKNRYCPDKPLSLKITAQGGVGTAEEHQFLLEHYQLDSVGWGTPFLLVPEAVSIDAETITRLEQAGEDDLYLSNISPLGVPFNNLRGNTKDGEKLQLAADGTPGSNCPKHYVALNNEFTDKYICTASRNYQKRKIEQLKLSHLSPEVYQKEYGQIIEKSCICVGLGTSNLLTKNLDTKIEGSGVSVCPGPNMAYFSKSMTLKEIIDHIYGRVNMISRSDRPNFFIKELSIYTDYLTNKISESGALANKKQKMYLTSFSANLREGVGYYKNLFGNLKSAFVETRDEILSELEVYKLKLQMLANEIEMITVQK